MALLVLIFFQQFVDLAPGLNEIGFSIDNTFVSTQASSNIEVHECFGPLFDGFGGGAALDVAFLSIPTLTAGMASSLAVEIQDGGTIDTGQAGTVTITTHSASDCSDATLETSTNITITAGTGSDSSFLEP